MALTPKTDAEKCPLDEIAQDQYLREGWDARDRGEAKETNPYPGTEEGWCWDVGWRDHEIFSDK